MCECLFVVKWSWQCTWVSCTRRYITVRQSHFGSCACCHETCACTQTTSVSFHAAPPRFTRTPEDQTGVQGGVASFVCQAAGDPQPKIVWNKKGKKVSNQRFEVWRRYAAESVTCYPLFMQFFWNMLKYCKLRWEVFSSFHFKPQRGLIECSD